MKIRITAPLLMATTLCLSTIIPSSANAADHPNTYPNYSVDTNKEDDYKVKYSLSHGNTVQYGIGCNNGYTPSDIYLLQQ